MNDIRLFSSVTELPDDESKEGEDFWNTVSSNAHKEAILVQMFHAMQDPPELMTDEQCRSRLAEIHGYYKMMFFRQSVAQTKKSIADRDSDLEEPEMHH